MTTSAQALKAAVTGAPAPQPRGIVDLLAQPRVQQGLTAVAGKLLEPQRLMSLCINAVKKTPKLLECDPASVLGALMASAALGLEPNTVQQQAFLIPYKRRAKVRDRWVDVMECQFQIGYRGFVTLIYRSPRVRSLEAGVIHEGDLYRNRIGTGPDAGFAYEMALTGRGKVLGAFSFVQLDGGSSAVALPLDELLKIRGKSETYRFLALAVEQAENDNDRRRAQAKLDDTPWVQWFDSMAMKSAVKHHAKLLPIYAGDMVAAAAALDDASDSSGRRLDLRRLTDPDLVRSFVGGGGEDLPIEDVEEAGDEPSGEAYGATQRQQEPPPPPPAAEPASAPAAATKRASPAKAKPEVAEQAEPPAPPPAKTYAQLAEAIKTARDGDAAALVLDSARHLPPEQQSELAALMRRTFDPS